MGYEWDPAKEKLNIAKHGMDFMQAAQIFSGLVVETIDTRKDYGETRLVATWVYDGTVLTVVYTWRGENRRLISARRANRHEREEYDRHIQESRRDATAAAAAGGEDPDG